MRTILREGAAERLNDWTIRFTHDDYRVDVNTASAEVITVIDEYDAEYNEAAQASLAQGEYNSLNALELEFSERARVPVLYTAPSMSLHLGAVFICAYIPRCQGNTG